MNPWRFPWNPEQRFSFRCPEIGRNGVFYTGTLVGPVYECCPGCGDWFCRMLVTGTKRTYRLARVRSLRPLGTEAQP